MRAAEERNHYVYGLHAGDGAIRYIGLTVNPRVRCNEHCSPAHLAKSSNREYAEWCLANLPVQMKIISEHPNYSEGLKEEMRLTEVHKEDWQLLNKAVGRKMPPGKASSSWGRKHTDDWRRMMSERMSGEGHPLYGKTLSAEHRAKIGRPGPKNHNSLFSAEDVLDIRTLYAMGAAIKDLAKAYGVGYSPVRRMVRRETYVNE